MGFCSLKSKKDYGVWNTVDRSFGNLNELPDSAETESELSITARSRGFHGVYIAVSKVSSLQPRKAMNEAQRKVISLLKIFFSAH